MDNLYSVRTGESTYSKYNDNSTEERYSVGITALKTRYQMSLLLSNLVFQDRFKNFVQYLTLKDDYSD